MCLIHGMDGVTAYIDVESNASRIHVGFNDSVLTGLRVRSPAIRVEQGSSRFAHCQSGRNLEREVPVKLHDPSEVRRHSHHSEDMNVIRTLTSGRGCPLLPTL